MTPPDPSATFNSVEPIRIGIDEVGRGSLCGPLVVAGCAVFDDIRVEGVKDSKKVRDEKRRAKLAGLICAHTVWCVMSVSPEAINKLFDEYVTGEKPMTTALRYCFEAIEKNLVDRVRAAHPDRKIIVTCDGDDWPDVELETHSRRCLVKADATEYEVSAASLVAKATLDQWVKAAIAADPSLSRYDLASSKGYGTAAHTAALQRYGLTPHHRKKACATLLSE